MTDQLNHPFMGVLARSIWGIVQRTLMASVAASETLSALLVDSEEHKSLGWLELQGFANSFHELAHTLNNGKGA